MIDTLHIVAISHLVTTNVRAADSLLIPGGAFDTPTGLPHRYNIATQPSDWLGAAYARVWGFVRDSIFKDRANTNSLVGIGSVLRIPATTEG